MTLDVLFVDEIGQVPADFISVIDIILRRLRDSNIFLGGLLIICTMDHTQIQPINARPFLTSTHIIPCFKMVALETSVRASGDIDFQRIQTIARTRYKDLEDNPDLVEEFIRLVSNSFTFVDNWESMEITPSTYRKFPAKEAARQFVERVRRSIIQNDLRERRAVDYEKSMMSHVEWTSATENTSNKLEEKLKEPSLLLFFRGAIFEFTYNQEGKFSQSQIALLFDLPSQDDIDNWRRKKNLSGATWNKGY